RLRHEDLLGSEGLIPQKHVVEGDVHPAVAVGGQLRGSARDASGPEILDALDHTGVEELETALDEDLLCEGVTDLHGWALRGLRVVEGFGSEDRGAADAVATGAGAEEHDLVAQPRGVGQAD